MSREHKFANIYKEMYASGEEGGGEVGQPAIVQIITNYYENQSNKFIIPYCYSFTSISNKTEIN